MYIRINLSILWIKVRYICIGTSVSNMASVAHGCLFLLVENSSCVHNKHIHVITFYVFVAWIFLRTKYGTICGTIMEQSRTYNSKQKGNIRMHFTQTYNWLLFFFINDCVRDFRHLLLIFCKISLIWVAV